MKKVLLEFSKELGIIKKVFHIIVGVLIVALLIMWVGSGFNRVKYGETAVKFRCGKIVETSLSPGVHYCWPWPVGKVVKMKTSEVRRLLSGFGAEAEDIQAVKEQLARIGRSYNETLMVPYCITGDKNVVHVKVVLQYRISEPSLYLFGVVNPEGLLGCIMQNAILESVAPMNVDGVLTTEKLNLQNCIMKQVKEKLRERPIGVTIVSVEVARTRPPSLVAAAFRDVTGAREEQMTKVHEAESYAKNTIHKARTEAAYIMEKAEAYAVKKKAYADGESQRFSDLATEYRRNKKVTASRLWLDTMAEILPKMHKYIVQSSGGEEVADIGFFSGTQKK